MKSSEAPPKRLRVLCVDGGGMRGLIPVMTIAEIERRLHARLPDSPKPPRVSDYFDLFAGTSTGGLIALALTAPRGIGTDELASFYTEEGPRIFSRDPWQRLVSGDGYLAPKYSVSTMRDAARKHLGTSMLSEATRDLLVTAYDMTRREPFFFKRWRALESASRDYPIVDAALATAAAPTYFPSHEVTVPHDAEGRALVDGGVFASNPTIAAIAEALGRKSDPPAMLTPTDLLVVSIGTGRFEAGFRQSEVKGWGKLGWIAGGGDEPPVLGAMLGGASDGTDYWAHMLLNHSPGDEPPGSATVGLGPNYYRLQVELREPIAMDDAGHAVVTERLPAAGSQLIAAKTTQIDEIVDQLVHLGPLPPASPRPRR